MRPLWIGNERSAKERSISGGRGEGQRIHLTEAERSTHLHVVGASGTGKSRFLEHLIRQDIREGRGLCLIDPHGTLVDHVVRWAALADRPPRTIRLLQPGRPGWTFGFNPLALGAHDRATRDFGVQSVVAATAQVWGGEDLNRTPRLRRNLKLLFGALAELGLTLPDAHLFLRARDSDGVRGRLIARLESPELRAAWEEVEAYRPAEFHERFESTQNRLYSFTGTAVVGAMLRQVEAALDTRQAMDEGHVLLVDLSEHGQRFAREQAILLGALLVNDFMLKARGRPEGARPYHLYVDECHHFLTPDVIDILFEARKFGLHLTLAHQDLSQLGPPDGSLHGAVMSGAQTKVVFRLGRMDDAHRMAYERMHAEIDYERPKEAFASWQTVATERVQLGSESTTRGTSSATTYSESQTTSEGTSEGHTASESSSTSESSGASAAESFDPEDEERGYSEGTSESQTTTSASTSSESYATSRSTSETSGTARQYGESRAETRGSSETFRPVIRKTYTQGYSLEEQLHEQARELAGLPNRQALLIRRAGKGSADIPGSADAGIARFSVPDVHDLGGPATERVVGRYEAQTLARSEFAEEVEPEVVPRLLPPEAHAQEEPEGW